jgi:hypothetical protein
MRVLILLDDAARAAGLAELVALTGHAAYTARDSQFGLALAGRVQPDVVILGGSATGLARNFAQRNVALCLAEPDDVGWLVDCLRAYPGNPPSRARLC